MSTGQQDTYRKEKAKEFWVSVIPQLVKLKRFEDCDEPAVVQMCQAYGSLRLTEALLARGGQIVEMPSKTGTYLQSNPAVGQWNMYSKAFERSLKQFGLYPAVRKRLKPEPLDHEPVKGKGPNLDEFTSKYDTPTKAENSRALGEVKTNKTTQVKTAKRKSAKRKR